MKGRMGFGLDNKPSLEFCECEECEEPELTDVQDGHHESAERVYSPKEMAEAFYELVIKLRAQGAKEIAAFEMAVTFSDEPAKPVRKAAK